MIVMFGLPDEMVEKNNKKVRNAFATQLEMTGGSVGGAKADMDQEATAAAAMDLLGFFGDFLEVAQKYNL